MAPPALLDRANISRVFCRYLAGTAINATVSEIAYAAGFTDLSYFGRCFRRRFGITPSERRSAPSASR
jgi:AraC-like DNA-binding protein